MSLSVYVAADKQQEIQAVKALKTLFFCVQAFFVPGLCTPLMSSPDAQGLQTNTTNTITYFLVNFTL